MMESAIRTGRNTTHGMSGTRVYQVWASMIKRCENPAEKNYRHYGGRGIRVCDRWRHSFEAFIADMGERPDGMTLDRVNVDGNYEPGNCRWATYAEQSRNTRRNRRLLVGGKSMTVTDAARALGVRRWTLYDRLDRGVDPFAPVKGRAMQEQPQLLWEENE